MSKTVKIISWVLIVLALVGAIGAIAYFSGGLSGEYQSFYLTVNGKDVVKSGTNFEATLTEPLSVEVKYSLEDENSTGYTVKIVPNALSGKDFDFTLDGDVYSYQGEKDLTAGFDIKYNENSFTVTPKGTLTEIMQAVYPNYTVGDLTECGYDNMFLLVVTSYDGEQSVNVAFTVPENLSGIKLDPDHIIF